MMDALNLIVPDLVRSDYASAYTIVVLMVIIFAAMVGFNFGTADIKGAYMQIGLLRREVYVRPPRDCHRKRGSVRKLLKCPYGMADAGRKWLLRVEDWILGATCMSRVDGVNYVFTKGDGGVITLMVAKVIDYFLIAGETTDIRPFIKYLSSEFHVGNTSVGGVFRFNGCEVDVFEGSVELSTWEFLDKLKPVEISRTSNKQRE